MASVKSKTVTVGNVKIGGGNPLVLIAGPCVIESRELALSTAETITKLCEKHGVPLIYKSSYKKANRTSIGSFTGLPMDVALKILEEVRRTFNVPVVTDIHSEQEAYKAAEVADMLQIPAFLCRQTELLVAAGMTGKSVNIKKGQFLAPQDMRHAALKVAETGNKNIVLTERGTTFGYNNLVVDMRSLPIMAETGYPVVLDATHSVQLPGAGGNASGGQPEFIFPIARAGVAAGCDGVFVETHPNPPKALSDPASQLPLAQLESLIVQLTAVDEAVRPFRTTTNVVRQS